MRTRESDAVHLSGAVDVAVAGDERQLLSARAGMIVVSAGVAAAPDVPGADGPFVAIYNASSAELPFVQELAGRDSRGQLDTGRTTIRVPVPEGEISILQLQIGPIPAGASDHAEGEGEVVTLVVSADRSAAKPGVVAFVGQAIGA
jgi:hypothetical protein